MEKARFNFAWVLAIIALIAYSYVSFMGLVYWQVFNTFTSAVIILAIDALIIACVVMMCKAKHTRWLRLGITGQILFGLIALVLLLGSSVMFSHFTRIVNQRDLLSATYQAAIDDASSLDDKYQEYVRNRCGNYEENLGLLQPSSKEYKLLFTNSLALGISKKDIISKCSTTLSNMLRGSNENGDLLSKRETWLKNASASVWNLNLPRNIRDVGSSVNQWIQNYQELSSVQYTGEIDIAPFEDISFNNNAKKLQDICTVISAPTILGILLAILCFVLILLPWIITPKNIASLGTDDKYTVEMPDDDE